MSLGSYSMIVAGLVGGPLAVLWLSPGGRAEGTFVAVVLGGTLSGLNAVAAYALVSWAFPRPHSTFFRAVIGGTLGRMVLLLGAVVAAIQILGVPPGPLVVALLSYYVVFLVLELAAVHRRPVPRVEATR